MTVSIGYLFGADTTSDGYAIAWAQYEAFKADVLEEKLRSGWFQDWIAEYLRCRLVAE